MSYVKRCPKCKSTDLKLDKQNQKMKIICNRCGFIIEESWIKGPSYEHVCG